MLLWVEFAAYFQADSFFATMNKLFSRLENMLPQYEMYIAYLLK